MVPEIFSKELDLGLCPRPRDLSLCPNPEARGKDPGNETGVRKGHPSSVLALDRRSGRFPALPCPPSRSVYTIAKMATEKQ